MRNIAASMIGNGVISLLWELRCHCNPDHDKFSSLSNTTVVAIFPNVCLWRRSLCSNLAGIDPEKLYRANFRSQYGLCYCIVWHLFLFDCFVKIWATYKNFLGKWFTAPLAKGEHYFDHMYRKDRMELAEDKSIVKCKLLTTNVSIELYCRKFRNGKLVKN